MRVTSLRELEADVFAVLQPRAELADVALFEPFSARSPRPAMSRWDGGCDDLVYSVIRLAAVLPHAVAHVET
jgi:hypothetical protein